MKVLFAGESWMVNLNHLKGADIFMSQSYDQSASNRVRQICENAGFDFHFMPSHIAQSDFPGREGLEEYDLVVLSDIGSDTFNFHPETLNLSRVRENRLTAICQYVKDGGGLLMFGGWNSFQGMRCTARYGFTPLKDVLPVHLYPYDDRNETPEGSHMQVLLPEHPVFAGVDNLDWPPFLGYNRLIAKEGTQILAVNKDEKNDIMIAIEDIGKGRSCAYASDVTTHWAQHDLTHSDYYAVFIENLFKYLAEPHMKKTGR